MTTPAESRWWYLSGPATLKNVGSEARSVTVLAYRDEGDWFFTPQDLDREWETAHITEAQRAADYSSQLKLDNDPGCPLEVRDVRVGMDKTYPSLRNVSFA